MSPLQASIYVVKRGETPEDSIKTETEYTYGKSF